MKKRPPNPATTEARAKGPDAAASNSAASAPQPASARQPVARPRWFWTCAALYALWLLFLIRTALGA